MCASVHCELLSPWLLNRGHVICNTTTSLAGRGDVHWRKWHWARPLF